MKSEEVSRSNQSYKCTACNQYSNSLLRLKCHHSFCIKCLTFSYHKFNSSMHRTNSTKCIVCQQASTLGEQDIQAINQFTNKVLVPLVREESEKESVKSKNDSHSLANNTQMSIKNKQFKSYDPHDLSTEKVTPAGKEFYSRCQSPKSFFPQIFCQVHPQQQLSIICFSCGNALLCISCIANKKHTSHNIKTTAKGLQTIYEQVALSRLKGKEYLDRLQISKRRLEDRRSIIQQRWDKTVNTIRLHFNNLLDLINRKCEEVIDEYSSYYQKGMEDTVKDAANVDEALRIARRQLERLADLPKIQTNPIEMIKKTTQLMQQIKELQQPNLQNTDIGKCDSQRVIRQIAHLSQKIQKLCPFYQKQSLKTHGIDNYKSQQKLLKENNGKRVKTNVISLNSSREKKEKKYTKTEEDQKRLKSKANYKNQSSSKLLKVNKDLPTYLFQNFGRKNSKDLPLPQCLMEFNPLQNSFKSTSKILSKSHIPSAEQHRRKKEHLAYIKDTLERKQRKTFNGTSKQVRGTGQGMRKKKIPS